MSDDRPTYNDSDVCAEACRSLWAAKLHAFMHDALLGRKRSGSLMTKEVARGWFGTEDFYLTCECANVSASAVLREVERRIHLFDEGYIREATRGLNKGCKGD